ncbi:MAG: TerB N-terminal domain-containing protein [Rhodospirillaceae bacterium]|nr:TerB N-terminal domain-containing protein [Rhodospirillaceae bacterium]
MARRKKSAGGAGWLLLGAVGLFAFIPPAFWVAAAAVGGVVFVIWIVSKVFGGKTSASVEAADVFAEDAPSIRFTYRVESTSRSFSDFSEQRMGKKLSKNGEDFWRLVAKGFQVGNITVPTGLVYFGESLGALSGPVPEPALIDPSLTVRLNSTEIINLPYWPSYSQITPAERGVFLQWLASGRKAPVNTGFVFIFFYGLERRLIAELLPIADQKQTEIKEIVQEIERLLSIYTDSRSFNGYATSLIDYITVTALRTPGQLPPLPEIENRREMPLALKVGLAEIAAADRPMPADWAFTWLMNSDHAVGGTSLRKSAELRRLFGIKYRQTYGDGLVLPKNKTRLKATYRAASDSVPRRDLETALPDLTDVSILQGPINKLVAIGEAAVDEIQPYHRYIARNPEKAGSADALILLPPLLWPPEIQANLQNWVKQIGADRQEHVVQFSELLSHLPPWEGSTKDRLRGLADALQDFGVGIEPDVRWGGPSPETDDPIVLFPLPSEHVIEAVSTSYAAAALTLHLGAMVAASDGISAQEEASLTASLEAWLDLIPAERVRLRAHLKWLLQSPPSLGGIKKRVSSLDAKKRMALGQLLVAVAQADTVISPEEIKVLKKIYKVLEIDESLVFSHAHTAATEPVTVQISAAQENAYKIPSKKSASIKLDKTKIADLKADSDRVSQLLGTIFTGEEEVLPIPVKEVPVAAAAESFAGLDEQHTHLFKIIKGRAEWTRSELQDLGKDLGLLIDAALEKINEACLDHFGEQLLEGDDPCEVNSTIIKEAAAA